MPASATDTSHLNPTPVRDQSTNLPDKQPPRDERPKPSRTKLAYEIFMLIIISVDLFLISLDAILMSGFMNQMAAWLTAGDALSWYQNTLHEPLRTAGGFFTLFLIFELTVRWAIAIQQKTYYRWFFFLSFIGMRC